MTLLIHPPNTAWPARFRAIKATLPGLTLHHIGSTAVPGLQAKDIIDIQITVPSLAAFDPATLSYPLKSPRSDHQPPGLSLPPVELAKYLVGNAETNIHIREAGRFNQRYPLLCRDYLRANPLAAAAYGEIKQNLARLHPNDTDAYYAVKDPVFDLLMAGAEAWAAHTGWTLPHPD